MSGILVTALKELDIDLGTATLDDGQPIVWFEFKLEDGSKVQGRLRPNDAEALGKGFLQKAHDARSLRLH